MKKFLCIIMLITSVLTAKDSFHDFLRENQAKIEKLSNFSSNEHYIQEQLRVSNIWETNIILETIELLDSICDSRKFFGDFDEQKAEFYNRAAHFYMEKGITEENRVKALKLWQNIIRMEMKELKAYDVNEAKQEWEEERKAKQEDKKKDKNDKEDDKDRDEEEGEDEPISTLYANYQNLSAAGFISALKMHRYFYQHKWLGTNYIREDDYHGIYAAFHYYYTNGLRRSTHLDLNMLLYFIETGRTNESDRLIREYRKKKDIPDVEIFVDLVNLAQITAETDRTGKYQALKFFIQSMKEKPFFRTALEDKFFNYANELIFYKKQGSTALDNRYRQMSSDQARLAEAIKYYNMAIKINPAFADCYYNKALIYIKQEKYPKARMVLKKGLKYKTSYNMLYAMGLMEMKMQNYDRAKSYLNEALFFQTNADILNNMAICHIKSKEDIGKKGVLRFINKAIDLDEKNFRYYLTRAEIYQEFDDHESYTNEMIKTAKRLERIEYETYNDYLEIFDIVSTNDVPRAIQAEIKKINDILGFTGGEQITDEKEEREKFKEPKEPEGTKDTEGKDELE